MFIGPWDGGGPERPGSMASIAGWPACGARRCRVDGQVVVAVPGTPEELTRALRRAAHGTIDAVTEDIGELHFNTAISKLMELTNAIIRARESGLAASEAYVEAVDVLLRLLAPIAPHISEELWQRRGHVLDP